MFVPPTGFESVHRLSRAGWPDAPVEPDERRPRLVSRFVSRLFRPRRIDTATDPCRTNDTVLAVRRT